MRTQDDRIINLLIVVVNWKKKQTMEDFISKALAKSNTMTSICSPLMSDLGRISTVEINRDSPDILDLKSG